MRPLRPFHVSDDAKPNQGPAAWRVCVLMAWLLASAPVWSVSFATALDRSSTSVGESVTLSLIYEDISPKTPATLPAIPNLGVAFAGQSSNFRFINGQRSSTLTHSYIVTATQPGDYTIPALRVVAGGQTYTSQPLQLTVTQAPQPGADPDGLGRFAFLQLHVPKTAVFVGEVVPVEIRLYVIAAENVQPPTLSAEGFTVGKLGNPVQSRTRIGNYDYHLVTYRTTATAAKAGQLELGPAQLGVTLKLPTGNRRRRDVGGFFDDDFFNDFFGARYQLAPKELASDKVDMTVQPLPTQNAPPGFNGAVGTFTFAVAASPTNIAVGDPITVKTTITGTGALDSLLAPPLTFPGFNSYPPTSTVTPTDDLGIQGVKTFEQVVVPENTTIKALPAIAFSFFNPDQKAFQTLTHPAIPLVVRPSAAALPPTVVAATRATGSPTPPAQDIVHIKPRAGTLAVVALPWVRQPWFLVLQIIPALVWGGAWLWRRRQNHLANHPRLRRRRDVARAVLAGLRSLPGLAATQRADDFFAAVFRLLQEQLGERLDLPASAITEAVIDDHLQPRGVDDSLASALHELFQLCNQARYAPVQSSQELAALVPKVRQVLQTLQHLDVG